MYSSNSVLFYGSIKVRHSSLQSVFPGLLLALNVHRSSLTPRKESEVTLRDDLLRNKAEGNGDPDVHGFLIRASTPSLRFISQLQ